MVISAEAAATQSSQAVDCMGEFGDAMRWGYNTGPRGNREMGGRGEAGVRAWRVHRA